MTKVPFKVDEDALNIGYEQMCEEMELEDDEEAKDFILRQRSRWKELARLPERVDIVLEKVLAHFLEYPDPNHFKAQLVAVDRLACARYKDALDGKVKDRGLPPEWSDVIISSAQNSEPEVERYEYSKQKQDDLIDYFKLTPAEWEEWNRERYGEDKTKWRSALKILIVCDRLLTGFDAPIEQVMYLDKPLRDHNLLQVIARTNRPLPAMKKRTGVRTLDIAKRLLDYGFHPPTIYFPLSVDEALLMEPTETEARETLEVFADALITIAQEAYEDPELVRTAPHSTPVRRLDDAEAARHPDLRWRDAEGADTSR